MNRSGTGTAGRARGGALRTTALLGVLAMAASCNSGGGAIGPGRTTGPDPRRPAPSAEDEHPLETVTLATYVGEYNGQTGQLTLTRVEVGPDGRAVQPLVLAQLPSMSSGSTGTTTPAANSVLLHQTATRQVDTACNTLASSGGDVIPSPFQGICVTIQAISGYTAQEIIRTYVEFSSLTNTSTTDPGTITTYVSAPPDSDFGTTDVNGGLFSYGRLAQAGVTGVVVAGGATVPLDRTSRNWFFQTPGPGATASFRFVANVKGELVNPIARPAPAVGGTECLPDPGSRPAVSADGRYVVYATATLACRTGGVRQVYRLDTQTGTNTLVSHNSSSTTTGGTGQNTSPTISADGRYVAWVSTSTNIVPAGGDAFGYTDSNGAVPDVFLRDMSTDAVYVISADDNTASTPAVGSANPFISPDGAYVVFDTTAQIDANGNDTNALNDVYRRDVFSALTELVSPNVAGRTQGAFRGAVANTGSLVVFDSRDPAFAGEGASTTSDVFLQDMVGATTTRVSTTSGGASASGDAQNGAISADGHVVAFESTATNMIGSTTAGRSHVYVRNADLSGLVRADFGITGGGSPVEASDAAFKPSLSNSGRLVVFVSQATNMDPLDNNTNIDAYMYDVRATDPRRQRPYVIDVSRSNAIAAPGVASVGAALASSNGDYGVFISADPGLVSPAGISGNHLYVAPLR